MAASWCKCWALAYVNTFHTHAHCTDKPGCKFMARLPCVWRAPSRWLLWPNQATLAPLCYWAIWRLYLRRLTCPTSWRQTPQLVDHSRCRVDQNHFKASARFNPWSRMCRVVRGGASCLPLACMARYNLMSTADGGGGKIWDRGEIKPERGVVQEIKWVEKNWKRKRSEREWKKRRGDQAFFFPYSKIVDQREIVIPARFCWVF